MITNDKLVDNLPDVFLVQMAQLDMAQVTQLVDQQEQRF